MKKALSSYTAVAILALGLSACSENRSSPDFVSSQVQEPEAPKKVKAQAAKDQRVEAEKISGSLMNVVDAEGKKAYDRKAADSQAIAIAAKMDYVAWDTAFMGFADVKMGEKPLYVGKMLVEKAFALATAGATPESFGAALEAVASIKVGDKAVFSDAEIVKLAEAFALSKKFNPETFTNCLNNARGAMNGETPVYTVREAIQIAIDMNQLGVKLDEVVPPAVPTT